MDILFARTLVRDFWNSDRTRPKRQGYAVVMEPRGSGKVPGPKLCFVGLGAIEENNMKRWILASLMGGALLAGVLPAAAQFEPTRHDRGAGITSRFSAEDMEAFAEARMAALRTGLRLSADQDKLWPPVEEAMRNLADVRRDQMRAWREGSGRNSDDLPAMLRGLSERQLASGEALRKLADAAAPLYAALDEGQKRRLRVLARGLRGNDRWREAHHGRGWHGWGERDGR
jgi:zinc resistance-associated protein